MFLGNPFSELSFADITVQAGSDAVLAGTSTITFSQTGNLLNSSVYFATQSITFSQTGNFSGGFTNGAVATIAFSQTCSLLASSNLLSTATIVFSPSGDLRGTSNHAGTSAITFSQTGDFLNSSILAATATILFNQTGNFLSSGLMAGTTTIVFSQTGLFNAALVIIHPFIGTDRTGAHEYFPWHNKDGVTVYFNKGGKRRHRYFPEDIERQDAIVRKRLEISSPTTIQELDWDIYNLFDVTVNADVEFTFSNPRDNSDFVILLTKDANANVRTITFPASLVWPDGNSFTTMSSSGETKLIRISYFGSRYRATLY